MDKWIEGFLRGRYGYEGNQVYRALAGLALILLAAVVVWQVTGPLVCLVALAVALLALRLRLLTAPVLLVGAILVVAWLLIASLKASMLIPPLPRFTPEGSTVVRNGVAAIVVCGEKQRGFKGFMATTKYAPEPRTGTWGPVRRGDCTAWYHRPPGLEQRFNRHERAQE